MPESRVPQAQDGDERFTAGRSASKPAASGGSGARAPIPILPGYYADESGRKRFIRELFDRSARDYDHVERIAGLGTGEWYRGEALKRGGLARGMEVLDVAAGTGLTARAAAALTGDERRVVAVDPSLAMLREARDTSAIALVQATGERLPFAERAFDFVSVGYALRHFSDLHVAFGEFLRVLKPSGTLCLLEISRPQSRLGAGLLRVYLKTIVPRAARLFRQGGAPERLMHFYWDTIDACAPPSTIMAALTQAGFERVERYTQWGVLSEYVARKPA